MKWNCPHCETAFENPSKLMLHVWLRLRGSAGEYYGDESLDVSITCPFCLQPYMDVLSPSEDVHCNTAGEHLRHCSPYLQSIVAGRPFLKFLNYLGRYLCWF